LTRPGNEQTIDGVTLLAPLNLPAEVPVHASQLYARNILNFLALIREKWRTEPRPEGRSAGRGLRRT
jgi:NAD(P) transhydrogenase subunit alpha